MPNVMAALRNIAGTLCPTPQSLADAHYLTAKTRKPSKLGGVPKSISAASRPTFTIVWGIWRRYCCLTSFFPIVDTCLSCEDIARQSCTMVRSWRLFGDFFASCISKEPRAARFRSAFQICTKATPCVEVWWTSNLRRLRLGKEKKIERTNDRMKMYMACPIT